MYKTRPTDDYYSLELDQGSLWSRKERPQSRRHYRVSMKQVVGAVFSGLLDQDLEKSLISEVIATSSQPLEDDGLKQIPLNSLEHLVSILQQLISSRVNIYLKSIATQLLDPKLTCKWSDEICRKGIIDKDLFGPLVPSSSFPDENVLPLYLMSFLCRSSLDLQAALKSRFDVSHGLTEWYLQFHHGGNSDVDIVDALHGQRTSRLNINRYQDLFPWDCTEAYDRYPVTCGKCNISKHVWAFPFDSWSIITLHLARGREGSRRLPPLSDKEWMRNPLQILLAHDVLVSAAAAMADLPALGRSTDWLHHQSDPQLDRLKLGGIHCRNLESETSSKQSQRSVGASQGTLRDANTQF